MSIWRGMIRWALKSVFGIGAAIGLVLVFIYLGGAITQVVSNATGKMPRDVMDQFESFLSSAVLVGILGIVLWGVLSEARKEYHRLREEEE